MSHAGSDGREHGGKIAALCAMLILLIALALFYSFFNGFRDSSSILAGVIASRAMRPSVALYLLAAAEVIAPFLFGAGVSRTVTTGVVDASAVTLDTIVIAMVAAVAWNLFTWWRGIPSSSTHALIGGLVGATWAIHGWRAVQTGGLLYAILPLFAAPIVGLVLGFLVMGLLMGALNTATPRVNGLFRRLQVITAVLLAMSNSANDSHKSMGIIALGLVLAAKLPQFSIPLWVVAACAVAMAFGASRGDWRQIRNLGGKVYRIRPLNALASQLVSSTVVFAASAAGLPVSTSHVISTALMGSGASERLNKVRWQVAGEMATAWVLTIPATMAVAAAIFLAGAGLMQFGGGLTRLVAP
jgi:inorganic phosphate transporter, PiT family